MKIAIISGRRYRHIMLFSMLYARSFLRLDIEESHAALKIAFKELYVKTEQVSRDVYATLEKGMNLREMADYKESYSQNASSRLIELVGESLIEIDKLL